MKQEDLKAARLIEAKRRWIEDKTPRREVKHLADLYETNWTPPEPVSDDLVAARAWHGARWPGEKEGAASGKQDGCFSMEAYLAGCTRGREGAKGLVEAVQWFADNLNAPHNARSYTATADAWRAVSAALASAKRGG